MNDLTSIVILTWNNLEYTQKCIDSIREYTQKESYELIIIDNGSTDGTIDWLKSQDDLKCVFNDKNNGFPGGCNQGINIAQGENILLLNNDIIVTPNWLENLKIALYSSSDIGAVSAITNYAVYYHSIKVPYDINDINSMIEFAKQINISNPTKWHEMLKLIGFCFLAKREVINKVGLLDEIFFPGNYEDDDYSLRIRRAGYRLLLCRDTFVHHYGSTTCKNLDMSNILYVNKNKFIKKWGIDPNVYTQINVNIINLIQACDSETNVLELNCLAGGTLLSLKNKFKDIRIFGVESNTLMSNIIPKNINILNENDILNYKDFFDIIIINNKNDLKNIEKYNEILKNGATIITTIDYIYTFEYLDYLQSNGWKYQKTGFINECYVQNDKYASSFNHELILLYKNITNESRNKSNVKYNLLQY